MKDFFTYIILCFSPTLAFSQLHEVQYKTQEIPVLGTAAEEVTRENLGLQSIEEGHNAYSLTEIIFKLKPSVESSFRAESLKFNVTALDALNQKHCVEDIKPLHTVSRSSSAMPLTNNPIYVLKFCDIQDIESIIQQYKNTGLFSYVEPNYLGSAGGKLMSPLSRPDDTFYSRQWSLYNDGSFTFGNPVAGADISMEDAWEIERGDTSVIVAILDSGLRSGHPEFAGRLWTNPNADIDDGYIGDLHGYDFANGDNDPTDDHGHGTNVTGIIAATGNNGLGYAGVDWNCKIMTGKILNSEGSGYYSWWIESIYYAVDRGAKVINMSVGGSNYSQAFEEAINYAYDNDVIVIACMMNQNNDAVYYPAGFSQTIAVGSTDPDDSRSAPFFWDSSSGSNYGTHIDVVAPGNYIYGLAYNSNSNYNTYWGGTSQATPLVAGLASLLSAQNPGMATENVRNILRLTAEDQVGDPAEDIPGYDVYYGAGRINAYEALVFCNVTVDISPTHTHCGENNGSATAHPTGGSEYSYAWSNGGTNNTIDSLSPGTYTLTVTSGDGCVAIASTIIQKQNDVNVSVQIEDESCYGASDGAISVKVTGGTPPYSYEWNTGNTVSELSNVEPGDYSVTVTDAESCSMVITATVQAAEEIEVVVIGDNFICSGETGILSLDDTYVSYLWNNGETDSIIEWSNTGTFSVTVTDETGCTGVASIDVSVNDALLLEINQELDTLIATVEGGTAPYEYLWNTGEVASEIIIPGSGYYSVTVTDARECLVEGFVDITVSTKQAPSSTLYVYPNPTTDVLNIILPENTTEMDIHLYDMNGRQVLHDIITSEKETIINLVDLPVGLYFLHAFKGSELSILKVLKM